MEHAWDLGTEQKRFASLWEDRAPIRMTHTAELWNERADEWAKEREENGARRERSDKRVAGTAEFLRARGLLTKEQSVIDIGCGPGQFVREFARTARHVTGVDISERMLEYGRQFAVEAGVSNVSFYPCDFRRMNIDELGWRKRFDLAFLSITPALRSVEDLDRVEAISRAYCFSGTFVRAYDAVARAALEASLPGIPHDSTWNGRVFYSLFNLLWLRGRYPEAAYYKEKSVDTVPADHATALRIAERLPVDLASDAVVEGVYRYIAEHADEDGNILYSIERWYGWLLWDVRDNADRNYANPAL